MSFVAVIVAAGSSLRAGAGLPKPWRQVGGKIVTRWSVEAMIEAGAAQVIVVAAEDHQETARKALGDLPNWSVIVGGASRAESVSLGLAALSADPETPVLVHDAARPFLTSDHVHRLLAALEDHDGAILALPVTDTLKRGDDQIVDNVDRQGLWRAQTPQAFRLGALSQAYKAWTSQTEPTDDAQVAGAQGASIALVPGDPRLMKLTYPEDFTMAEALAGTRWRTRTGMGVDAHRWGPGDGVWLCGILIPFDQTLVGHSDADAGLHALTDAILGAIGDGDIGEHFPPSDPQWKGVSSDRFLRYAGERVRLRGGRIVNVDVTLICEQPRIRPHRDAMRQRLAELLDLPLDGVSVKATTTEGMGYTGRQEGLLAQAIATVELPA